MHTAEYKIKSVMLGHAVGDALGVPVEFTPRTVLDRTPVTDMMGYGTYNMPAGCWSDDTSMALAALDSLKAGKVDWGQIMGNFAQWVHAGRYTPTGVLFDIGGICRDAIRRFEAYPAAPLQCGPTDEYSNGNGSLMRIHPFSLYAYFCGTRDTALIHDASALTHGHLRSRIACGIYTFVLWALLDSPTKAAVQTGLAQAYGHYKTYDENRTFLRLYRDIGQIPCLAEDGTVSVDRSALRSDGYVVSTLEAAVWCLLTTDSFEACVLKAVNLGEDTDTTAAVAGGLAGALYGLSAIPADWRSQLKESTSIESLCAQAAAAWTKA
ncbi:MAG: ADP-ribosylglycohydrolase family protein [Clostridia bacterium]|nr:ADP-ribosylglycohydrolase family protein [Clostridia bacterium]